MRTRGFTLIELLVVLGVTTLLASGAILYGSTSRKQTTLYIESAKLSQAILGAKSQAVRTYYDPNVISCGYGIRVDRPARAYALFNYVVENAADCTNVTDVPDSSYVEVERTPLNSGIVFTEDETAIRDILFIPPDPTTLMWTEDGLVADDTAPFILATDDGSAESRITVNKRGQVSFR